MTAEPRTTTLEVSPGTHVCAVPVSNEQHWAMVADFVRGGLNRREQVLYFDDDGAADHVLGRLREDRVDVRPPLSTGQLAVVPAEATRAAVNVPVDELRANVSAMIDGAAAAGWDGIRMTGQFGHTATRPGGYKRTDMDVAVDAALVGRPATLLCVLDPQYHPADEIEELRAVHASELLAPSVYDDTLLRLTRSGTRLRASGEIDHSNRVALRRELDATLDEALRAPSTDRAGFEIWLDLASLRFIDVAGAVSIVHAAEEYPSTHRLVLDGVRPAVARLLDRCGAPFAAQLTVQEADAA